MSELDDDIREKYDLRTTEGKQLANEEQILRNPSEKNKWVALLLCNFSLILGLHYHYVGRSKTGLIYSCTICGLGILRIARDDISNNNIM